ncbi:ABC transporter permease [Nocardioides jishulii]|uniref:FtsX-like permease family protein n=1 Tax=Nocardioides jishulii TaxID=2575440 RepID=A0A4U2YSP3_9ACTN|nr:FtsX-like permease family protein [Nocardioides jishulii]QCX26195.1 FtsX-like permease family protein [Nocardioides jishulii]TKI64004.1 FtsX-like permease family protein [Nocardioides jishulii]
MRTVLLASLRHNSRRYVASALAVIIGVAFIVTTEGLAGALRSGMTADLGQPYAATDHVVQVSSTAEVEALLAAAEKGGFAARPDAMSWGEATYGESRREASLGVAPTDPQLQWQPLVDGTFPTRAGEALVDERVAAATGVSVGDDVVVRSGGAPVTVSVIGVAEAAVGVGSDLYLTWEDLRAFDPYVPVVLWDGPVAVAERTVDDPFVRSSQEYVAELQSDVTKGVDVIALLVAFFAAIALGVAVLVIANTFAILFAQRARDFALLRCVGVTRAQLRRSIRVEALTLGVVSSALGLAIGVGLSFAIAALVGSRWAEFGAPGFRWWWVVGAAVFGVLVSVVAAWLPTRAATRVAPLAALRPAEMWDARSNAGRVRLGSGALLIVIGSVLLARAVQLSEESVQLVRMVAGGGAFFVGVLLLGPVVVPALVRLAGWLTARGSGALVAGLAASNAARNPRRTATTTASLMVGVTLTVAMVTGLGVISEAMDVENDLAYPIDAIAVVEGAAPLDEAGVEAVRDLDEVDAVLELPGVMGSVAGIEVPVVGLGTDRSVMRSTERDPHATNEAVVPWSVALELPDAENDRLNSEGVVDVRVGGRTHRVSATVSSQYGDAILVKESTLRDWGVDEDAETRALWVRATEGADAGDLETGLARATSAVPTAIGVEYSDRQWVEKQLVVITAAVIGLLSIGIVIALIGIVNTLGLSVLERTRENALLRAMGLTRRQLRRVLAVEGALLAGVASLLGSAVGLFFAWVGVKVVVAGMIDHTFSVAVLPVVGVLVAALAFGALASVLPARKAARISPAEGLTAQ